MQIMKNYLASIRFKTERNMQQTRKLFLDIRLFFNWHIQQQKPAAASPGELPTQGTCVDCRSINLIHL